MTRPRANWKTIRAQLLERSNGFCEVSGIPLDPDSFDAHHRRNKGMGGTGRLDTDTLPNLLALDPVVHNLGPNSVHGRRTWSDAKGYLVPKHVNDAGLVAVWLRQSRWVWLLPEKDKDGEWYCDVPERLVRTLNAR